MLKLIVLYPHPSDEKKFEEDYRAHLRLFDEKNGITGNVKPYKVTKMIAKPAGLPEFYQMFSVPFNSPEELEAAMSSPAMGEIAADAQRISTGGPPVVMIGNEE